MGKYQLWGNEKLAPMAYDGNEEARREIESRGNFVVMDRKVIQKTIVWNSSNGNQCKVGDLVVIENGKIVKINGVKQP